MKKREKNRKTSEQKRPVERCAERKSWERERVKTIRAEVSTKEIKSDGVREEDEKESPAGEEDRKSERAGERARRERERKRASDRMTRETKETARTRTGNESGVVMSLVSN